AENDPLTYTWEHTGGLSWPLDDANSASPSFISPPVYDDTQVSYLLTVSDGYAHSQQAVTVILQAPEHSRGSLGWLLMLLSLGVIWRNLVGVQLTGGTGAAPV